MYKVKVESWINVSVKRDELSFYFCVIHETGLGVS